MECFPSMYFHQTTFFCIQTTTAHRLLTIMFEIVHLYKSLIELCRNYTIVVLYTGLIVLIDGIYYSICIITYV